MYFGIVDGERFSCVDHVDLSEQYAYFDKYTACVNVTNILVSDFKGRPYMQVSDTLDIGTKESLHLCQS